jgi:hypothetical protein
LDLSTAKPVVLYCGWYSLTGKPEEPQVGYGSTDQTRTFALKLQENGKAFYRTQSFSARGIYYWGTWGFWEDQQKGIMRIKSTNNMKEGMEGGGYVTFVFNEKKEVKVTHDNLHSRRERDDESPWIPKVLGEEEI